MWKRTLSIAIVLLAVVSFAGCGSNRDSDGDVVTGEENLADANTVGIDNCLTCHNGAVGTEWLGSRHGNDLTAAEKDALNEQSSAEFPDIPVHEDDPRPDYDLSETCQRCHDQLGDGRRIDQAVVGADERPVISCESCHGGGQFHRGIGPIPFPTPGPDQCGQCHGVTERLFHRTSGDGNNVIRNIADSHNDDETTPETIEGYNVKVGEQTGCVDCHYTAHTFDLTINNQWASSGHGGEIGTTKREILDDLLPLVEGEDLFEAVRAAGVTSATGDPWVHYDWDDTNGVSGRARGSCQRCHTATGVQNFLNAQPGGENYDPADNDFSYLTGWTRAAGGGNATASGENEMLYCWGCHEGSEGAVHNPGAITLDYEYLETPLQVPIEEESFVVLPDKGDSNVCAACHSGRGNDTSIRQGYADAAADPADNGLSSRFAGHRAPTAGSLYAAVTHTGFEFTDAAGDLLDYTTPFLRHDDIDEEEDGPCVSCHMGGPDHPNHTFEAVSEDATGDIVTISNQALCDSCHAGAVNPAFLNDLRGDFDAARQILLDLVDNVILNYKGIDISASANRNAATLSINDYGAFQNSLYMLEEPCIRVHNSFYGRRLMFDSIDWLEDGSLDGTINDYGADDDWMVGAVGTARP